ncbi:unnamed protein product [Lota lota]
MAAVSERESIALLREAVLHLAQRSARGALISAPTSCLTKLEDTQERLVQAQSDVLRWELDPVRKRLHVAEEDRARLQSTLNRKNQECQDVAASREALQKQADQQVQELEDALGDVQKRMVDSECKVKKLQAQVVAVKEHLGGQAAEELRGQLQEVKAKYEGASAEVGRVRNRLKQSEKTLEEYKSSEGRPATEAKRLGRELGALSAERDKLACVLQGMQSQLQDAKAKPGNVVPAEKFDTMKNLLTNAVDEKERQLVELREDYDWVLEEVAELHRAADNQSSQGGKVTMPAEEHQRIRAALDDQNASLKRRLGDVTAKSQELMRVASQSQADPELKEVLQLSQQQCEELGEALHSRSLELELLQQEVASADQQVQILTAQYRQGDQELTKLRSEYSGMMKELAETNGKLQQEEHQRKALEVGNKQNVSQLEAQLQDTKRHWEELQNYHYKVNAER